MIRAAHDSVGGRVRTSGANRRYMRKRGIAGEILVRAAVVVLALAFVLRAQPQRGTSSVHSTRLPKAGVAVANSKPTPDFTGVYDLVPDNIVLPGGLKNIGSPEDVPLQPSALATQKKANLKDDAAKNCEPVGPFRMMALPGNRIELLRSPDRITMLFQNISVGHLRTFYLDQPHQTNLAPLWVGDSTGQWNGDTLIVDTTNFNQYTWLNSAGAPHSGALHLIERYRFVPGGKYLEVKMTADDPEVLIKPYTYTRYYERSNTEIQEDFCTDDIMRTD